MHAWLNESSLMCNCFPHDLTVALVSEWSEIVVGLDEVLKDWSTLNAIEPLISAVKQTEINVAFELTFLVIISLISRKKKFAKNYT